MLDEADGTPLNIDTNADLAHERRTARGEPNGNQSGEADSDGATAARSPHWTQPSQLSRLERFDSVTCGCNHAHSHAAMLVSSRVLGPIPCGTNR